HTMSHTLLSTGSFSLLNVIHDFVCLSGSLSLTGISFYHVSCHYVNYYFVFIFCLLPLLTALI
ncbi:MAG TPA: hypothetical protein VEF53_19660, partial [Patescibacteria group bacterium]|nr:hypothetical protein [Patescibacteria group bacterium]